MIFWCRNNCIRNWSVFLSFSDSGIDVTEEERENHLLMMNGLSAGHHACEPLENINALRDTLRHLKETTDKAVVRFLIQSRDVIREEIKSQSKLPVTSYEDDLINEIKHVSLGINPPKLFDYSIELKSTFIWIEINELPLVIKINKLKKNISRIAKYIPFLLIKIDCV